MTNMSLVVVSVCALLALGQLAGASPDDARTLDSYYLQEDCLTVLNEQISWEMYAGIVYLNMYAYLDRPSVGRQGYAKFFGGQSFEEFGHAKKIIDYINSRNGTVRRISVDESPRSEWVSPREALSDAIKLEKHVYSKLQHIHDLADQKCQDSHLTDFLESYFFVEQVESIKELQTMLTRIEISDPVASSVIEHLTDVELLSSKKD